jgi:hypothetical protein
MGLSRERGQYDAAFCDEQGKEKKSKNNKIIKFEI